jgi:hypothetical protein
MNEKDIKNSQDYGDLLHIVMEMLLEIKNKTNEIIEKTENKK